MERYLHGDDDNPDPAREAEGQERQRRLRRALEVSRQTHQKVAALSYKLTGGRLNDPPRRRQ